jgi:hypothetical protein
MNPGERMAVRTMSFDSDSIPERWHLTRKLALLFLLVLALALGLVILFRQRADVPLVMFNLLADVSIGLVIGLGTRWVLNQRHGFIQALASAALAVIGLMVLGYFTDGKSGIGFPPIGFVSVNWLNQWHIPLKLPLRFDHSQMNWPALAYMVITVDTSWIALRAWKRSMPRSVESSAISSRRVRRPARASRANASPSLSFPKVRIPQSNARPKVRRKRNGRSLISKPALSSSAQPSRSKQWNPLHRKPKIQLAVYEEHRCPYCLEDVKRNDPRGIVECEVCHTLHHKDCWDITGACQVPHLNT